MIHFIVRLSAKFLYTVCLIFHASIRSTVKEEQNLSGSVYCRRFAIKEIILKASKPHQQFCVTPKFVRNVAVCGYRSS